jgi:phospholipid/cholesterol/gamma-HCH transport system substrate-binding protein
MRNKHIELGVGLFMIVGIAALAYLTVRLGAGAIIGADTYGIEARFANTGGLNTGASVKLAGVTVGRVEGVRLDPTDYSAIADLEIISSVQLPSDTMASIRTAGLIGDKFIALAPGAEEDYLAPSARIFMTESAIELESLISKMAFGEMNDDAASGTSKAPEEPGSSR